MVSRFSRQRPLAVIAVALAGVALALARASAAAGAVVGVAAVLVLVLGGRAVAAEFAHGRVRVSAALPGGRPVERSLAASSAVRVETLADARRRGAERRARAYRERAGSDLPGWLRPSDQPGANDHLRRLVLEGGGGEPFAVTAWLPEEDLEAARVEVETWLRGGG